MGVMINIKLINPLIQFGKINLSLIITDDAGRFPPFRVEKKYLQEATKTQIAADIKKTFIAYIQDLGISFNASDVDGVSFTIDKKGGTKDTGVI